MKIKRHPEIIAPGFEGDDPIEMKRSGIGPRFTAASDTVNIFSVFFQIGREVNGTQHRLANDALVPKGKLQKKRQSFIGHFLIFAGAGNRHIGIPHAPVPGQTFEKALRPFGEKGKKDIPALPHHGPGFGSPDVGIRMEKIRREADPGAAALGQPGIRSVFFSSSGQIKLRGFDDLCAVDTVARVNAVHIAPRAAGTDFGAAVPGIPYRHDDLRRCWLMINDE